MLKFLFQCNTCGCKEAMVRSWNNKLIAECNVCHDFEYIADTEKVNTTLNLDVYVVLEQVTNSEGNTCDDVFVDLFVHEEDALSYINQIKEENNHKYFDDQRVVYMQKRKLKGNHLLNKTFVELCLLGKATPDQIDDYVDKWHDSDESETRELHEFLGMTEEEYGVWIHKPKYFETVLASRSQE